MAKSRMAGDALRAKREKARERIGNNPERLAERLSAVDRDAYDFSGYSDKEINMAFQGSDFGEKDYARLTGIKPGGGGGDEVVVDDPSVGDGVTPVAVPESVTVTNNAGPRISGADLAAILAGMPRGGGSTGRGPRKQIQSFDRVFGDNRNTMGDGNVIYGGVNQGNQDYSLNFGYQGGY